MEKITDIEFSTLDGFAYLRYSFDGVRLISRTPINNFSNVELIWDSMLEVAKHKAELYDSGEDYLKTFYN